MKMKLLVMALCFGVLAGCASNASEEQPVSAAAHKSGATSETSKSLAADKEEEKICKVRPITGSRFKQKTCMTAKEWENMAYETKKMLEEDTRSKPSNY
ncbi:hypothetical protein [Microbulbifer magnicolonia]|uniref:hypothetical protein n=1 Tax=Microbulbifer magnicolonia TaxID=3109744 RepID=UPI002B40B1CA|nr:hypothetical protein [Microbulbifer sp. GG15]